MRDANGAVLPPNQGGVLVVETPLPYMFATVWNDPDRFAQYFRWGVNVAGDVATIDDEGDVTVRGRADDVASVAGHRIATADVESALVSHKACGEVGVCGVPDEIKGEAIVAYVVLRSGFQESEELAREWWRTSGASLARSRRRRRFGSRPNRQKRAAARSCGGC